MQQIPSNAEKLFFKVGATKSASDELSKREREQEGERERKRQRCMCEYEKKEVRGNKRERNE